MKFYHRTNQKAWEQIQQSGYLKSGTYFAPTPWLWYGDSYGDILLEIEYTPLPALFGKEHNYGFDPPKDQFCVQFCIFKNIPLADVKRINEKDVFYLKKRKPQLSRTGKVAG